MARVLVLYNWMVIDPIKQRPVKTRYKATEDEMLKRDPEATRIESTREERVVHDDFWAMRTSAFLRNKTS